MNHVDVAIVGGGSAGSLAAAVLGRAGTSTLLIDMHRTYPREFRCEKVHDDQADVLAKTGLAREILSQITPIPEMWESRRGWLIGKLRRKGKPWEYGCAYEELVAAIRSTIPANVPFVVGKATTIKTSEDTQTIELSSGETWTARLVILAIGPNNNLFNDLGITRTEISKCHSVTIGFDLAAKSGFKFPALTYFAERSGPSGYVSIFPIKDRMRVNWFLYHDIHDTWVQTARVTPLPVLLAMMPRLKRYLEGTEIVGNVSIRPVDLNAAKNYLRPGIVLAGDSFGTSCPAAGTGLNKVFMDAELLCNHYIPKWLKTPGMGVEKLQDFYNDPAKVECDRWSLHEAIYQRSLANDKTLIWAARRWLWIGATLVQGFLAKRKKAPQDHPLLAVEQHSPAHTESPPECRQTSPT